MYTPDKWIVITLLDEETNKEIDKVLAGWYGSYLYGDSWKINSGITDVKEEVNYFDFTGHTGSVYRCYKHNYGLTGLTARILDSIPKDSILCINKYETI